MKLIIFSLVYAFTLAMNTELHLIRMADSNSTGSGNSTSSVTTNSTTSENFTSTETITGKATINNTAIIEEEKDILDEIKEILEEDMLPNQRAMKKKLTGIKENQAEIKTLQSETEVGVKASKGSLKALQDTVDSLLDILNAMKTKLDTIETKQDKFEGGVKSCFVGTNQETCGTNTIRLRDKFGNINPKVGRLEVFSGGRWGTVLDDAAGEDHIDANNNVAKVVCHALGYGRRGMTLTTEQYQMLSSRPEPLLIYGITCSGNEPSLDQCQMDFTNAGHSNAGHTWDLGIDCN